MVAGDGLLIRSAKAHRWFESNPISHFMTEQEIRKEITRMKTTCFVKVTNRIEDNIHQLDNWKKLSDLLKELIRLGISTYEEKSDYLSCQEIIKRISNV